MKKAEAELVLLNQIKEHGLKSYSAMQGEGRKYNNVYYCFYLKNGHQVYWTNPSDEFKKELGIE